MLKPLAFLPALLLVCSALPFAQAQVRGGPKKSFPRKEDIPLIKCEVCELLAKTVYEQVAAAKAQAGTVKPVRHPSTGAIHCHFHCHAALHRPATP
jgi:hypothetical protein